MVPIIKREVGEEAAGSSSNRRTTRKTTLPHKITLTKKRAPAPPMKRTPKKAAPRKAAPRKTAPRKAAPRKAAPRKAAPRKATQKTDVLKEEEDTATTMDDDIVSDEDEPLAALARRMVGKKKVSHLPPPPPEEPAYEDETPLMAMARTSSAAPSQYCMYMIMEADVRCGSARELSSLDVAAQRVVRTWHELVGKPEKSHNNIYHSVNSVCKHSGGALQLRRFRVCHPGLPDACVWWMLGVDEGGRHDAYIFEETCEAVVFVGTRAHERAAMQVGYELLVPGMSTFSTMFDAGFRVSSDAAGFLLAPEVS